ncbi:ABC transporter permease [Cohnella massiliensis]|uniref:ABC transporter permease n=1 Tax=Cohnella massiliensis TaxID=1816691 RepID=UPI00111B3A67|nr:ABC-2 family transporter protein [Cohnella massiliensis]
MRLFRSFSRQAFHNTAVYRFDFWLQLVAACLMMYSVHWVWNTLYAQSPQAFGVSLRQMIAYGILGMALETVFAPGRGPQTYMAEQVKTGSIDTDLSKPLDFHFHMLARNFGETLFRFCALVVPSLLVGAAFLGLQPPPGFGNLLLFLVSLLLGYFVLFSLNFLVGTAAVLTLDIGSVSWAYNALLRFFAGQMVPFWLFPDFLEAVARCLPFQSIYYIPITIYIGKADGAAALEGILLQAGWALLLLAACRLAWNRVQSRLIVQGG